MLATGLLLNETQSAAVKAGSPPHMNVLLKMRVQPAGLVDIIAISPSWLCSQLHPPQWKSTGVSADCVTVVKSRRPVRRAGVRLPRHVTGSPSMRCTAAPLNSFQLWQKQEATLASCPDKDKQTQEGSVARPMLKALAWIRQQWPRLRRNWGNKGWKERLSLDGQDMSVLLQTACEQQCPALTYLFTPIAGLSLLSRSVGS